MEACIPCLRKIGDRINEYSKVFIGVQCLIMTAVIVVQVILRLFTQITIHWAMELACYLFVWSTMLGSAIASKSLLHIKVDVLTNALKGKIKTSVQIISYLCLFLALIVFIISGAQHSLNQIGQKAITMPFSMGWVFISIPISGVLMMYHSIVQFLELIYYGNVYCPVNKNKSERTKEA